MTQEEAIALAEQTALANRWPWIGEVQVHRYQRGWLLRHVLGPKAVWDVKSNAGGKGSSARIVIDDKTGKVLHQGYLPR